MSKDRVEMHDGGLCPTVGLSNLSISFGVKVAGSIPYGILFHFLKVTIFLLTKQVWFY